MSQYCEICYNEFTNDDKFVKLGECNHMFCEECFKETFTMRISDKNLLSKISCPQHGCDAEPTEDEIRSIVSPEIY